MTDRETEIRAAALRCFRYLIVDDTDKVLFNRLHLDCLSVRCLDMDSENYVERIQAVRLYCKLLDVGTSALSECILRCLCAHTIDGETEHDKLTKASLAIICGLALRNSRYVINCCDYSWLIRSLFWSVDLKIHEALMSVLINIINCYEFRSATIHTVLQVDF